MGSIYLHNDSAQQAAQSAETGFAAASPTAVFDSQGKFFDSLSAAETTWVKNSITSRRQLSLIVLMNSYPKDDNDIITSQLATILGSKPLAQDLKAYAPLDTQIANQRTTLAQNTASVDAARQLYVGEGGDAKAASCVKPTTGWPSAGAGLSPTPDLNDLHLSFLAMCGVQDKAQQDLDAYLKSVKATPDSPMGTALSGYAAAQTGLADQKAQAARLKDALSQAQKAVDSAKAGGPSAKFASDLLKLCASDSTASATSASAGTAAAAVKAGTVDASLSAVVETCLAAAASGASPLLREVQHNYLATQIQMVLSSVLASQNKTGTATTAPASGIQQSTAVALQTSDLLLGAVDQIRQNSRPSVNALLVALAYEQYQVGLNQLMGQTLQKKILVYQEQREALIDEVAHLARARIAADKLSLPMGDALPNPGAATVLTEVNAAWSVGQYRYELAEYADIDLTRRDAVARSRQVASAWTNLLQPGFAELTAYGKGGIDAQTVANFLTALVNAGGFAAVAGRL